MRDRGDSNFVDGWVGEFIISMHYPWGDILQKTERSLMAKWGLENSLSNSHEQANADFVGAGGSGGSIYLKANHVVINNGVSVAANGGASVPWISAGGNTHATDGGGEGSAGGGGGAFSSREHPLSSTMQVPPMQISLQRVDRARQPAEHRAMGMTAQFVWFAHK